MINVYLIISAGFLLAVHLFAKQKLTETANIWWALVAGVNAVGFYIAMLTIIAIMFL